MPNLAHEKQHGRDQGLTVCGVDEAGRGPLAGPVTAAAVVLPFKIPRAIRSEIRDSKKMSAKQRDDLFGPITQICVFAVAEATVTEIAELNILWASMLAMRRAVELLTIKIDIALIDGNRSPELACKTVPIIQGDDKSLSIAAASILAKVSRDRLMAKLAEEHPGYGWERNAGYGTSEHLSALEQFGVTKWHRRSFAPVFDLEQRLLVAGLTS